jgi:hypothetical protein
MDLKEIDCENGRWAELAQVCTQWWSMILVVLNLQVAINISIRIILKYILEKWVVICKLN